MSLSLSRVAKHPIAIPTGMTAAVSGQVVEIKAKSSTEHYPIPAGVKVSLVDNQLEIEAMGDEQAHKALAGTTRANLNNIIVGLSAGFVKQLELVGVGYRAEMQGKALKLTLGFSHPVEFKIPEGITIETPNQTTVLVKGASKHQVGQVAANIRAYRPPECYKGKGIRFAGEVIQLKETKKK